MGKGENLIARTVRYGSEPRVAFSTNTGGYYTLQFKGIKPAERQLVLIKRVLSLEMQKENGVYFLSEGQWREPSLRDFLDPDTAVEAYSLGFEDYSPEEFRRFFENHAAQMQEIVEELLSKARVFKGASSHGIEITLIGNRIHVGDLLPKVHDLIGKVRRHLGNTFSFDELAAMEDKATIFERFAWLHSQASASFKYALSEELEESHYQKEKHLVKQAHKMEPRQLLDAIKQAKSRVASSQLRKIFMLRCVDENNRLREEYKEVFEDAASMIREFSNEQFRWTLAANATGISVDISKAVEAKAYFDGALAATRVGNISNGDSVIIAPPLLPSGKPVWVKGNKALKRRVKEAGGKLKKYGCILTAGDGTVYSSLMEIARLNALAALDPDAAVAFVKSKGKDAKRLEKLVSGARQDYKKARKLADVAVEMLYNIDPDSARKLISSFGI